MNFQGYTMTDLISLEKYAADKIKYLSGFEGKTGIDNDITDLWHAEARMWGAVHQRCTQEILSRVTSK